MAFAVRRARVRAGQLGAMALVVAGVVVTVGWFDSLATQSFDAGVAAIVDDADPTARAVVVDAPLADDASAQDAEMRAAISEAFAAAPVSVARAVQATAEGRQESDSVTVGALADPGASERARMTDGAWPTEPSEVALTTRAAERLGIGTGDELVLDGAPVTVVGVWDADDAGDPLWSADPAVGSGLSGEAIGPVLMLEERMATLERTPHVRWTVLPTAVTTESAPEYLRALDELDVAVDVIDPGGALGVRVEGRLEATIDRALDAVSSARGALIVPLLVFCALGAIALGVIAAALQRSRRAETQLLRARGTSAPRVFAASVVEAVLVGALGATVGAVVVIVGSADAAAVALTAVSTVVGTVVVVGVVAFAELVAPSPRRSDAGRGSVLPLAGALLLVGLVAALATLQLLLLGGVVAPSGRLDPLAAAAGGLVLVALGLVAALAVGPAALAAARLARRGRRLTPVLALRRLARQSGSLTAGVLCVALAAGSGALALRFTTEIADERAVVLTGAVGADLRASYDIQESIDLRHPGMHVADLSERPGIDDAFAALARMSSVGSETVPAVAAPADELAALASVDASQDAADSAAAAWSGLAVGTPLPYAGDTLTVTITAEAESVDAIDPVIVSVSAWSVDADGAARQTLVGSAPADGAAHTLDIALSDVGLLALDVALDPAGPPIDPLDEVVVEVSAADSSGELALPQLPALTGSAPSSRLVTVTDVPDALPVVITEPLASRVDAAAGTALTVRVGSAPRPIPVRVEAVVASIPGIGDGPGFAIDLSSLSGYTAREGGAFAAADELWVRTDDLPTASESVRSVSTEPVVIATAASVGTDPVLVPTLALFGGLAGAAALLAIGGFLVVAAGVDRDRRAESIPLRAFGFDLAAQRGARTVEVLTAAAFAVVMGTIAGIATAALVLPVLVPALAGVIR